MKFLLSVAFVCLFGLVLSASTYAQKSPPATMKGDVGGVSVEVNYHQPSARGRQIMGGLVPYDKVWRTGANAATTIEFGSDATVGGKSVSKGIYSLYTIPGEKTWTIIINGATGQWGTQYPEDQDVARFEVPAGKTDSFVEAFTISEDGENVILAWENTEVKFSVKG